MRHLTRLLKALRGRSGRQLLKLTAYAIVCLAVLAGLVACIGNVDPFADHRGYEAELPDATGLHRNDAVKVTGVAVGKVTGISLDRGKAVVRFQVDEHVRLVPADPEGVGGRVLEQQEVVVVGVGEQAPLERQRLRVRDATQPAGPQHVRPRTTVRAPRSSRGSPGSP